MDGRRDGGKMRRRNRAIARCDGGWFGGGRLTTHAIQRTEHDDNGAYQRGHAERNRDREGVGLQGGQQHRGRAHKGTLPCFLAGRSSRLSRVLRSASASADRVSAGSITSVM